MVEKLYIIRVYEAEEDYFFVLAKNKTDAINRLQEYWNPINDGMGKLFEVIGRGQSLNIIRKGRHLAYFKRICVEENNRILRGQGIGGKKSLILTIL